MERVNADKVLRSDSARIDGVVGALAVVYAAMRGLPKDEACACARKDINEIVKMSSVPTSVDEVNRIGRDEFRRRTAAFYSAYFARGHAICTGEDQT